MVVQFCYDDNPSESVVDASEFEHQVFATIDEALSHVRACNAHVHLEPHAERQVHPAVMFPFYSTRGLSDAD